MVLPIGDLAPGATLYFFWAAWLDVLGDPVLVTTIPGGYTFSGTGDADLDGVTFAYIPSEMIEISDVTHSRGGADPVTATLCGVRGPNDDLLTALSTRANWQGRTARLWHGLRDAGGTVVRVAGYYTGDMVKCPQSGDPATGQNFHMTIENYTARLTAPRGRTYQDQGEFDSGDVSPARMRSSASGAAGAAIGAVAAGGASRSSPGDSRYINYV